MPPSILGLDVGGANLKAVHSGGPARLVPFALWREPQRLPQALAELLAALPPADALAVTMTGELCDCFPTRRDGVLAILDAVEAVAGRRPVHVYTTAGRFAAPEEVRRDPLQAAAANWLALAAFAGRLAPDGPALLIDVGSTTTDLIPLRDGIPVPVGRTDSDRLASGELVYTGVRRTPVCALLGPEVAAEWFATTLDVYLVLGDLPESADSDHTADGRPATRAGAHARLARLRCADAGPTFDSEQTRRLAERAAERQRAWLHDGLRRVLERVGEPKTVVTAGSGEFLARRLVAENPATRSARGISLGESLGPERSDAACAHAVAVLVADRPEGRP